MSFENPSIADFKSQFVRDFPYGTDPLTSVTDQDIGNAFNFTNFNFNPCFYGDQSSYTLGYLLLSAHYLATSLRASSAGISGQYSWFTTSKGVGSISESYQIPQQILDNPVLAMLAKTNYGAQYLMFILPQLAGAVSIAYGRTLP